MTTPSSVEVLGDASITPYMFLFCRLHERDYAIDDLPELQPYVSPMSFPTSVADNVVNREVFTPSKYGDDEFHRVEEEEHRKSSLPHCVAS